eukprot:s5633_g2.t1
MALRGREVAQQNRRSSGEGIWIIKPIAGNYMMAIMGAKVTLCQVAMLSICSEDMRTYTAEEFVTGFKKRLAFQPRGIKKNRGSSGEGSWITQRQPSSLCTSPDVVSFTDAKGTQCRMAMFNIGQ